MNKLIINKKIIINTNKLNYNNSIKNNNKYFPRCLLRCVAVIKCLLRCVAVIKVWYSPRLQLRSLFLLQKMGLSAQGESREEQDRRTLISESENRSREAVVNVLHQSLGGTFSSPAIMDFKFWSMSLSSSSSCLTRLGQSKTGQWGNHRIRSKGSCILTTRNLAVVK